MIHEYALEPDLVATWTDRQNCRYFSESFGVGRGRLVSRYPKRWGAMVYEAVDQTSTEIGRKRIEELLKQFAEHMIKRSRGQYDSKAGSWLDNAIREHEQRPFHAILARSNPEDHAGILVEDEVDKTHPLWDTEHSRTVSRQASEMAAAVAPVLRSSSVILFVDPYFNPDKLRYRRTLEAFLLEAMKGRVGLGSAKIEVLLGAKQPGTESFFRDQCLKRLSRCVPSGARIVLRRLEQKTGGEKLHNRYILTNLGGIEFGVGLDDGKEGETDDLVLLDEGTYRRRWSQYFGDPPPAFQQSEASVTVEGCRATREETGP